MTAAAAPLETRAPSAGQVAGLWGRHLLSLYLPLNSLAFLWTGPHPWYLALLFMAPLVAAQLLDSGSRTVTRQPLPGLPAWPFDALVYGLAALQFLIVLEAVRLGSEIGVFSFDMLMMFMVVGSSSGFSIVTAHELIHRRRRWEQQLGRLLLCSVLYEHFYTEHIRGHHVRVGTPEDPATARFGEAYEPFFRRTVPAQLRSAWRLEKRRLGMDPDASWRDRRMLGNRIVHGLVLEWGAALAVLLAFGPTALVAFLLQALAAVRLLEAVNYFEHWGLVRRGKSARPEDSWDTHSVFTYYALIGLTRHADHHARASRPYQRLRVHDEAPLLPVGYVGMVDMVMGRNTDYQALATAELARRELGPFHPAERSTEGPREALSRAQAEQGRSGARSGLGRAWRRLPGPVRLLAVLTALVVGTAAGVHWETGGDPLGFGSRLLLHGWILGGLVAVLAGRRRLQERVGEGGSWALAFAAIGAVGWLSSVLFL